MAKIEKKPTPNGAGKIGNAAAKNRRYIEPPQKINIMNRIKK